MRRLGPDAFGQPVGSSHRCSDGRGDRQCDAYAGRDPSLAACRLDDSSVSRPNCDRGTDRASSHIGARLDPITSANSGADRGALRGCGIQRDALHRPGRPLQLR